MDVVMIANTAEAFATLLKKVADTPEGVRRIRHELTLSQRAFFWGDDNKLVITPYPIPPALLEHSTRACGYTEVANISLREPTVALSKAVFNDADVKERLRAEAKSNPSLKLSPYAYTEDFLWLLRALHKERISVNAEGVPTTYALWTAKYLDSKLGFRLAMQGLLQVPEGYIARNKVEALSILKWFYSRGRSAVVKVNFGESGWGLWICRIEEYQSSSAATDALKSVMGSDPVWKDNPLIVEEFIEADVTVAGGSPSVELLISDDGSVITYHCGQVLNATGEFFGVEIGKGAVPANIKASMEQVGKVVGERYHALGYRGYCDIDFVVGKDGNLYAVETNPRRTGGTHVYDLARHLFGEAWEDQVYLISHDSFHYGDQPLSAEAMLERTQLLLYPIKRKRSGVIITSLNAWDTVMGYVVIVADLKEGRRLLQKLLSLFNR